MMLTQEPPIKMKRQTLVQGEAFVSADPATEYSTVLGSCIAACLYDGKSQVGGMNHFLLGEPADSRSTVAVDEHYGAYLMELLINQALQLGANRRFMRAHLYGGASLRDGLGNIGEANALFAKNFLQRESIPVVRIDVGGNVVRRVYFRPASGQVRCNRIDNAPPPVTKVNPEPVADRGAVEFF